MTSSGRPIACSWLPATRLAMVSPGAGEHRQAHEQRIVGGRAGVVGHGVEKQVGVRMPREMLGKRDAGGEDQPCRIDAACRRLATQVDGRGGAAGEATARSRAPAQQPHPDVEHARAGSCSALLKQQNTNALPRAGRISPREGAPGGDLAPGVARAIAIGQIEKALGEERLGRSAASRSDR